MNGADHATGRRPRTPSAQVASELLNAAESVLVKDGMRGLTVRAVAAKAGVAPMSVYNQFGGKAGLLAALPLRGLGRLEVAMEAGEEADARARLRHGAVALELSGLAQTLDPARTYRARGHHPARASGKLSRIGADIVMPMALTRNSSAP